MTKMDRPDGLGALWIAAGAALALLFVAVTVLAVVGKTALLGVASDAGSASAGLIAGGLTAIALVAVAARWGGVRKIRMWMLTVLLGLCCGAWIVVLAGSGAT